MSDNWKDRAKALASTGALSWRKIAKSLNVSKSTCSDYLRSIKQEIPVDCMEGRTHLVIPDSQVKPGVSLEYLRWIGEYICKKRPDTIIHLGDFADLESLSTYDKGKKSAEGKRVQADIESVHEGLRTLLTPLWKLQAEQIESEEKVYKPRLVITLGNHCNRLSRHVEANPELDGFLDLSALKYEEYGFEVVPFLTPINIDHVNYCHYYPNVMTGKPLGGSALSMLKTIGESFVMGHRQTLDVATRFLPASGKQQWGIISGACYTHEEVYKGKQGNHHWRGIITLHNVRDGSFDPLFISLDWLERTYGKEDH